MGEDPPRSEARQALKQLANKVSDKRFDLLTELRSLLPKKTPTSVIEMLAPNAVSVDHSPAAARDRRALASDRDWLYKYDWLSW